MRIQLIAVGERPPRWVADGYAEYAGRLRSDCALSLHEVAPARRGKTSSPAQWREEEGRAILAAIPQGAHVVALDVQGRSWTSEELAGNFQRWLAFGKQVALLVGGADGLSAACRARADETWSLSKLTFPHGLVRVVVAEQLYRAWSLTHNHPYHRA